MTDAERNRILRKTVYGRLLFTLEVARRSSVSARNAGGEYAESRYGSKDRSLRDAVDFAVGAGVRHGWRRDGDLWAIVFDLPAGQVSLHVVDDPAGQVRAYSGTWDGARHQMQSRLLAEIDKLIAEGAR